jgi:hypothetical protein
MSKYETHEHIVMKEGNESGREWCKDCKHDLVFISMPHWTNPMRLDNYLRGYYEIDPDCDCNACLDAWVNEDPTPYCSWCKAKTRSNCDCGPRAEND